MSDLVQKIRGEFEAWLKSEYPQEAWSTARYLEDDGSDQYREDFVEGAWRAWQARQALASTQERGEAVAWMTEDGERCVTERTMAGARKDGGAMLSSLSAYVVPLTYAHPPADAQRVAELELEIVALTCNQDGLLEALEGLLSVVSVRIDDPRIKQFDAARHAVAIVKGGMK